VVCLFGLLNIVCSVTDECIDDKGKRYELYDKVKRDCNSWLVSNPNIA